MPFRIEPNLPASAYQTYSITAPTDIFIKATCEDTNCPSWQRGWQTLIDERTELGAIQGRYIRHTSGRTFKESRTGAGLTVFTFDRSQRCFTNHHTRPEVYRVGLGDYRSLQPLREHTNAAHWVEDFSEHQALLHEAHEKG